LCVNPELMLPSISGFYGFSDQLGLYMGGPSGHRKYTERNKMKRQMLPLVDL
jgi:hypothetical protein